MDFAILSDRSKEITELLKEFDSKTLLTLDKYPISPIDGTSITDLPNSFNCLSPLNIIFKHIEHRFHPDFFSERIQLDKIDNVEKYIIDKLIEYDLEDLTNLLNINQYVEKLNKSVFMSNIIYCSLFKQLGYNDAINYISEILQIPERFLVLSETINTPNLFKFTSDELENLKMLIIDKNIPKIENFLKRIKEVKASVVVTPKCENVELLDNAGIRYTTVDILGENGLNTIKNLLKNRISFSAISTFYNCEYQ